jgi:group II intron reverse transcriptase/maturase/CRISPR-associated endonuclease Cas1
MHWSLQDLESAWSRVLKKHSAGGFDQQSLTDFSKNLHRELSALQTELNSGQYVPDPSLRVCIPKGKGEVRPLGLLTIRDKIAQHAVKPHLEAQFEPIFHSSSYAYRPNKGHRKALARLEHELSRYTWVATADIHSFFDSLDHDILVKKIAEFVKDSWLQELLQLWLEIGVVQKKQVTPTPKGVQQGGVVSPILANLYLNDFDHALTASGIEHVRYADDFIMLCRDLEAAKYAKEFATTYLSQQLRLEINPDKSACTSLMQGFTFLGIYFKGMSRRINQRKMQKAMSKIYGFRHQVRTLDSFLLKASRSYRSWWQHYQAINPQEAFWIYDRILGNEISLYLQLSYQNDGQHKKKNVREKLKELKWLLYYRSHKQCESWAQQVCNFNITKLSDQNYYYIPFPRSISFRNFLGTQNQCPGASEKWQEKLKSIDRHVEAPKQSEDPAHTVGKMPSVGVGEPASKIAEKVKQKTKRRRRKIQRMFLAKQDLVIAQPGSVLRKKGGRIAVVQGEKTLIDLPVQDLKHVWLLTSNVTLTGPMLRMCIENQLPIEICGRYGRVVGRLTGPEFSSFSLGAQQEKVRDGELGLSIARNIVDGKIDNQIAAIKYFKRSRRKNPVFIAASKTELGRMETMQERLVKLNMNSEPKAVRAQLTNIEAQAAQAYWAVVRLLVPNEISFMGRKRKGARDLVNSLLNYGYGVLYNVVWTAVVDAGLNPSVSFLHEPFRNKPTLTYDLIEEFRAPLVDRVVFSLLAKHEPLRLDGDRLTLPSRRLLVRNMLEKMNFPTRYRSTEMLMGEIPSAQARLLAKVVQGEKKSYKSWSFKW